MPSWRGAFLVCGVIAAAPLAAQQPGVSSGVTISKDTVTVGEPFQVRLRVRAPLGSQIVFPDNPDSTGTVQARDPRVVATNDSVQWIDQTATYTLAAWDVEDQPVRLGEIVVVPARGAQIRVAVPPSVVFVRSVLPADSAQRVPKPARPLWETAAFPWWIIWLLAAALAIALLLWWWLRRRQRSAPPVVVDPYAQAQKEFNRLEAMGLVDAGERTRFVALAVEVLRDYLAAKYPEAALALTSRELVSVMRSHGAVPQERLARVLHEADLAKFARWAFSEEAARALAREARGIVEHEHRLSQPAEPARAA